MRYASAVSGERVAAAALRRGARLEEPQGPPVAYGTKRPEI
ncbi:MAG: hypothetical protein ACLUEK_14205 [Oscillospiraceae bacterium]